jgi:hypothetical protein
VADRLKQVRFAQSGIAIDKQWIIRIPRRLAYRYAACVRQPIARPDNKILESIIRVKSRPVFLFLFGEFLPDLTVRGEFHADKMTRYLLCGLCKRASAFTLQKLGTRLVRAANLKRPARQTHKMKIVKPLSGVDRVQNPCPVQYLSEDIFYFTAGQDTLLYKNPPMADKTMPLQTEVTHYK